MKIFKIISFGVFFLYMGIGYMNTFASCKKIDSSKYLAQLIISRYGHSDSNLTEVWKILMKMGYQPGGYLYPQPNTVLEFPSFSKIIRVQKQGKASLQSPWLSVWDLMIRAVPANKNNEIFITDLVQITASVLFRQANYLHFRCSHAFDEKDKNDLKQFSSDYLALILEIDRLLYDINTEQSFLNAVRPQCNPEFRHCLSSYYFERWKTWLDYSQNCILTHHKVDLFYINKKINMEVENVYSNSDHLKSSSPLLRTIIQREQITRICSLYTRFKDARLSDLE